MTFRAHLMVLIFRKGSPCIDLDSSLDLVRHANLLQELVVVKDAPIANSLDRVLHESHLTTLLQMNAGVEASLVLCLSSLL